MTLKMFPSVHATWEGEKEKTKKKKEERDESPPGCMGKGKNEHF